MRPVPLAAARFSPNGVNAQVEPSTLLPMQLGNSYTASMYTGLASLIHAWHRPRAGAQIDTDKETMGKKAGAPASPSPAPPRSPLASSNPDDRPSRCAVARRPSEN